MNSIHSTSWHLPIEISIMNEFMDIKDLIAISKVDKHFHEFSKKYKQEYVHKLFEIIKKCNNVSIYENKTHRYSFNRPSIYERPGGRASSCLYKQQYWQSIFGNQLNPDQLAIYYAFFISTYNYSSKQLVGQSQWACSIFPNGFIKCLASKEDGSIIINNSDKIIRFNSIYKCAEERCSDSDYKNIKFANVTIESECDIELNKQLFKKILLWLKNNLIGINFIDLQKFTNIILTN